MLRILIAVSVLAAPVAVAAQSKQAESGQPPKRIRSITLGAGEKCPESKDSDEIVVCGTIDEPYRIPKELRQTEPSAANQSWVNRAATIDEVGRVAGGLPNTCSPVGSGGQTGCLSKFLSDYAAEKREKKAQESTVP